MSMWMNLLLIEGFTDEGLFILFGPKNYLVSAILAKFYLLAQTEFPIE
jgi:hypothetical protein